MPKKTNETFNSLWIAAHYKSYDAQISFLATMAHLGAEYPEHFEISADDLEYFVKKIRIMARALEVVEQYREGRCNSKNCMKAINLIDEQIRLLEGW